MTKNTDETRGIHENTFCPSWIQRYETQPALLVAGDTQSLEHGRRGEEGE